MLQVLARTGFAVCVLAFLAQGVRANPPVEAFGNLPFLSHPALAPDGRHFAAVQEIGGKPAVAIYTVHAAPGDKPAIVTARDWIIAGLDWAKNDRLLIYIKIDSKIPSYYSSRLYTFVRAVAVDLNGGNELMLLKDTSSFVYNTNVASVSDKVLQDPRNIYMEEIDLRMGYRLDLFKVDVRTGDNALVARGASNTAQWYTDGDGGIAARLNKTSQPLADHLEVPENGGWRRLADYPAGEDKGAGVWGVSVDGTALVRTARDAGKILALDRVDLKTGQDTLLWSDPRYDVEEVLADPWTGRVIGASYLADKREFHYLDPKMDGLQKGLEAAFPNLSVRAVSWDKAMTALIVEAEAPKTPPAYYYLDRATHQATQIGSAYPQLKEGDLGEMKPYPYKARDGLDIPAYLTLPPGKAPKNLPAVVMPHGGPDARDSLAFDWWAQFLANRGYAVLQPNFRGSSGYGHAFTEAGLHQWGLKMQDDVSDGVKKLVADGIADPKRVCIVGASYGGYAALAGATLTPDLYACAVSFAGISDLQDMLTSIRKGAGRNSNILSFWASRIGDPDDKQLAAISPARNADKVKCPIMLLHGEGDTTVPIHYSELMADALKEEGKPYTFVRFPGEDHYLSLASTRIRTLNEIEAFLKANIGN